MVVLRYRQSSGEFASLNWLSDKCKEYYFVFEGKNGELESRDNLNKRQLIGSMEILAEGGIDRFDIGGRNLGGFRSVNVGVVEVVR